ncbi:MAG TPA: sensor domain-containing diguanylate cyclase, partial [Spirochaetes bacterium]|nr:sensor domain-containing diguanylate cyclase [Spirochaetota bacterium]
MDSNVKSKEQLDKELAGLRKTLTHMITVEIDNLKAENLIKSQEEFNKTILSSLNAQIAVLNTYGEIIAVNKSWESFARKNQSYPSINYSLGSNLPELYQDHPSNKMLQQIGEGVEGVISGYLKDWDVEHLYETSMGKSWYQIKLTPMGRKYGGAVLSRVDISELKESEQRYAHLTYHDSLTGLSNRLGFQDQFHQALEHIDPGDIVALMFIDLDRFKFINDTLGHTIGDKVLKEIAERLNQCQLGNKILSRWGGDEFTIVFPGVKDVQEVTEVAENILNSLSKVYQIEGYEFFLS